MSDINDWSDEALEDADRDQFRALNRDLFLERKAAGVLRADAASWKRLAELANARCDRLREALLTAQNAIDYLERIFGGKIQPITRDEIDATLAATANPEEADNGRS